MLASLPKSWVPESMYSWIDQGTKNREANTKTTGADKKIIMNMVMDSVTGCLFITGNFTLCECSFHDGMNTGLSW